MKSRNVTLLVILVFLIAASLFAYVQPIILPGQDEPVIGTPFISNLKLGLDLSGGTYIVFEAIDTPERPLTDAKVREVRDIIEERINRLGLSEPIIQRLGDRRIVVQLPGVDNPDDALAVIGTMAKLEFRDEAGILVTEEGIFPNFAVPPIVTGANLVESTAMITTLDNGRISNVVSLDFDREGTVRFAEATTRAFNEGRAILIFLDDEVVQIAGVREPITTGKAMITDYESLEAARQMEIMLDSGSLPVDVEQREMRYVSATLGQEQISSSIRAGFIGIALIVLFMLFYYRIPGLVANMSLILYAMIVLGVLMGLNAHLTLPGIAGLILSVGMAVDANVIIFERIKEELRIGKTVRASVESGFRKAFRTILDSNITTLIAAGVLFYFGSGPIRGFAITLAIGILVSMFTAIVITRRVLRIVVEAGQIRSSKTFIGI
jgi:preprotein translocase subunit SecD